MKVRFHKQFKKQYKKLPDKVKASFDNRLVLYIGDQSHPLLHVHPLKGEMIPLWSLNVTGNYRALFTVAGKTTTFHYIGTHSELSGK